MRKVLLNLTKNKIKQYKIISALVHFNIVFTIWVYYVLYFS